MLILKKNIQIWALKLKRNFFGKSNLYYRKYKAPKYGISNKFYWLNCHNSMWRWMEKVQVFHFKNVPILFGSDPKTLGDGVVFVSILIFLVPITIVKLYWDQDYADQSSKGLTSLLKIDLFVAHSVLQGALSFWKMFSFQSGNKRISFSWIRFSSTFTNKVLDFMHFYFTIRSRISVTGSSVWKRNSRFKLYKDFSLIETLSATEKELLEISLNGLGKTFKNKKRAFQSKLINFWIEKFFIKI